MPLFFITGQSGAGKSQLTLTLRENGYEAYDTDDDGLARWQHNTTQYIHPKSSVKAHMRTEEFLAEHSWNIPRDYIEQLADSAQTKTIFLLGVIENEVEVRDLFARTFALQIDDATMTRRLQTRTNNNWGKQPHELQRSLAANKTAVEQWRALGYTIIDATQPIDKVVSQILEATK